MFQNLLNIIIGILLLPFLICIILYFLLRKLVQPKWSIFNNTSLEGDDNCQLLSIPFKNISMKEALEGIRKRIDANQKQTYYFINPHAANIAQRDVYFKSILEKNEWNFPDGIGLKLAGFIEGYRLKENLNGTDLFPGLMEIASDSNFSVYFLGAEESVLKALLDRTKSKWPQLHIAGSFHGYFDKENDTANVVQKINDARADLLLVSFGMPLQEKWIDAIEEKLKVKAIFATGGLFDFYSGTKKRAPEYLRQIGMEWLYRLYIEPGRMWKRYIIGNPLFLANVIRNKYLNY